MNAAILRCLAAALALAAVAPVAPAQDGAPAAPASPPPPPARGELGPETPPFTVRPGYRVTRVSTPGLLRDAGFLAAAPRRALFVAEPAHGSVALLRDDDHDGVYETAITFIDQQPGVHGLQFHRGWLYFATPTAIGRARDTDGDLLADDVETVLDGLDGLEHDRRALLVTRHHIYTAVGDAGDATDEPLSDRQKVWRYNLNGGGRALWAAGVRATDKLHVRPWSSEIWGFDRASGSLGRAPRQHDPAAAADPFVAAFPPDEFNRYDHGGFFGHPYLVGAGIPRREFADRPDLADLAAKATPPRWQLPAGGNVGGWTFISARNHHFPPNHRGDAFVASYGSDDDAPPRGFRIDRILFDDWTGLPYGNQLVVETLGGDNGRHVLARPLDVVEVVGGSLVFSSNHPEPVLYRIEWAATAHEEDMQPSEPTAPLSGDADDDEADR